MAETATSITICMGSSCFSRGNNCNVEIVEQFLLERNLLGRVKIGGCLCDGHCKEGPNIRINDELLQGVEPGMMLDLLEHKLGKVVP